MSKQIIKNGIYNRITCACECEFAFDKTDIEENVNGEKIVTCPQCGAENKTNIKAD